MAERALIGAILAAALTALARRFNTLDESGQWGAFACGVAAAAAGWSWAILLVVYFVAATAVSIHGAERKAILTAATNPQVPARNGVQVLANGALFAILAVKAGPDAASRWGIAAAGALAAASADTWATEIGTLWGGKPVSIATWRQTLPGMSGGVTAIGTTAAVFGAVLVALAAAWLNGVAAVWPYAAAVAGGGLAGSLADSMIGGTLQARRWCEHCKEWTERRVHPCSYRTVHAHGFRWVSNDAVNAAATFVGATAALGIAMTLA